MIPLYIGVDVHRLTENTPLFAYLVNDSNIPCLNWTNSQAFLLPNR